MSACSARVGLDDGLQTTRVCALRRLPSGTLPGRGGELIGRSLWASAAPVARTRPMAVSARDGALRRDVILNPPLSVAAYGKRSRVRNLRNTLADRYGCPPSWMVVVMSGLSAPERSRLRPWALKRTPPRAVTSVTRVRPAAIVPDGSRNVRRRPLRLATNEPA